jgi:AraC family transcriptional regulator, regulatory protein of adaptative response / methylated-DNA-[protein]-cysteine methyltransferase
MQCREKIVNMRNTMIQPGKSPRSASIASGLNEELAWQQLQSRDGGADFYYGVATTGVFCRPDCKSRLPLRVNTRFFADPVKARAAGFRPCMRCKPEEPKRPSAIAAMCAYLESHRDQPVRLATLGKFTGMSPFTAQRLFKEAMGVTPSQYQRAIRANALRSELRQGQSRERSDVTSAIYEAGYGSASRAYEAAPLGMTPGKFLAGGRGETIHYTIAASKQSPMLGSIIIGATDRGICWLALGASEEELEAGLREEFPAATILPDQELAKTVSAILDGIGAHQSASATNALPLDLRGTAFQLRVWKALQQIPAGETRTYSGLAAEMGMPKATRAVARACALNRVSVLVPCHRVVGMSGSLTGYRWGVERKRELLKAEGTKTEGFTMENVRQEHRRTLPLFPLS